MSRRIERRESVEAQVGHPMDLRRVRLTVEVCGPSTGRSDGKPSQEPWPDEPVVVISGADDDGWEAFADVESVKVPLRLLARVLWEA